ncbi:Protein-associating with the carboxyl-terminal domain of ezrin [Rhizoclosmatium sp. JEL0117]|nr:Protein-associating with the carboxyl-terminal domain of ezrin [Rhizoclosmatium sp. JEL0117]
MGASESKMKTYFHKDDYTSFQNFTPPDTYVFTHYNAIEKESNQMVSIFTYGFSERRDSSVTNEVKAKLPEKWIIVNALQRFRTLRHPGIIKFREAILTDYFLYVITEPVIPLARLWNELPSEEIALGIYSTLKTISFLHNNELCHNNLQFSSLYVSIRERTWLLGGLEFTTPVSEINKSFTKSLGNTIPREIIPPEDFDPNVIPGSAQSRDYFALGHLLTILLSNLVRQKTKAESILFDWRELQRMADGMTAMNPTRRISVHSILEHPVFAKNQFILVVDNFLKNVRALEPSEKILGFKRIAPLIRKLPPSTVTAYILPSILNVELFSEPGIEIMLKDVFSQKRNEDHAEYLLPSGIFGNFVIPFISKSIKRREFDIRRIMLKLYPVYFEELFDADAPHFVAAILPEILLGLNEVSEEIYVHTLLAICLTIPRLFQYEFERAELMSSVMSNPSRATSETSLSGNQQVRRNGADQRRVLQLPAKVLVESFILPRVLNACVDPQLSTGSTMAILKRTVGMWKVLCGMESSHDVVKPSVFLVASSFKSILGVLRNDIKYAFVTDILVGGMGSEYREGEEHWLPKVIEVLVPFLISSDDHLRSIVADVVMQSVTLIAQYPSKPVEQEYTTPITDRRIERTGNLILHTGPRRQSFDFDLAASLPEPTSKSTNALMNPPPLPTKISFNNFDGELDQLPAGLCAADAKNSQRGNGVRSKQQSAKKLHTPSVKLGAKKIGSGTKSPAYGKGISPSQEFTEISLDDTDTANSALTSAIPVSTFRASKMSDIPVFHPWEDPIIPDSILSTLSVDD